MALVVSKQCVNHVNWCKQVHDVMPMVQPMGTAFWAIICVCADHLRRECDVIEMTEVINEMISNL